MTEKPRLFLSPPDLSGEELVALQDALASGYAAPVGPHLDAFEQAMVIRTDIDHGVALSSGTASLHLALRVLGIGEGDLVACATLTFIGGVAPVNYLGARPVFIDVDPDTWTMDVHQLERALNEQEIRAIITTDLFGQCCDLDAIMELAFLHGIPVIADSAEAMGATYKGRHAGKGADAAVFSFNGNKIITTSGGGMLMADDPALVERARFVATQAKEPTPHFEHREWGYNYRLSNLLAAVGLAQMRVLDQRVERKRAIFETYKSLLSDCENITFMPEAVTGRANRWLTVILLDGIRPEAIRLALEEENIESRPAWMPMHLQPVYREHGCYGGTVAEGFFDRGLCLPSGTALTDADLERIAGIILQALK